MESKIKFFKPSFNAAMTMMRGSYAMVVKLAFPSIVEAEKLPETGEVPATFRQAAGKIPEKFRQKDEDDASDASKSRNDIKILSDKVEEETDVEILSAKAENRACLLYTSPSPRDS